MKVMLVDTPEDPVRLAFLHVFRKRPGMQNSDGSKSPDKFEVNPIIKPGGANHQRISAAVSAVAKEKYGDDWKTFYDEFADDQKGLRKGNLKRDKSDQVYSGFEDMLYVVARNETRPGVFDRDTSPLVEEDGKPYSGCYGNVEIDIWALKKQGVKKRIVTDLLGVQFTRDGDAFGTGSAPSKADSFQNLSAAEDGQGLGKQPALLD